MMMSILLTISPLLAHFFHLCQKWLFVMAAIRYFPDLIMMPIGVANALRESLVSVNLK
jgi:hypothetical protein